MSEKGVIEVPATKVLSKKEEKQLKKLTASLQERMSNTVLNMIQIGVELNEAKALLAHGQFGHWLEESFDMSVPSANRFMRVAKQLGDVSEQASKLSQRTLYLLTSKEAKYILEDAKKKLKAGEQLTHADVEQMIGNQDQKESDANPIRIDSFTKNIHKFYADAETRLKGYSEEINENEREKLIQAQEELDKLSQLVKGLLGGK